MMDKNTQDHEQLSNIPDPNSPLYSPTSVWRFSEKDVMESVTSTSSSTRKTAAIVHDATVAVSEDLDRNCPRGDDGCHCVSVFQQPASNTRQRDNHDANVEAEGDEDAADDISLGDKYRRKHNAADYREGGPTFFGWR